MHVPINVKSPNNISEWQMGFNSTFKRLTKNVFAFFHILHLHVQHNTINNDYNSTPTHASDAG